MQKFETCPEWGAKPFKYLARSSSAKTPLPRASVGTSVGLLFHNGEQSLPRVRNVDLAVSESWTNLASAGRSGVHPPTSSVRRTHSRNLILRKSDDKSDKTPQPPGFSGHARSSGRFIRELPIDDFSKGRKRRPTAAPTCRWRRIADFASDFLK